LPYKEAAEVCFSRRMELLSSRPPAMKEEWPFFSDAHQNRYYESGLHIKHKTAIVIINKLVTIIFRPKLNVDVC
jgi:hypothetical protein